MKIWAYLILLGVASCCAQSASGGAQTANDQKPEIAITQLSPPIYPPLSRLAHIAGDVQLELKIRSDGSVASVVVLSGHPMLKQAAVESAQKSQFSCKDCPDTTSYRMTYTFSFLKDTLDA